MNFNRVESQNFKYNDPLLIIRMWDDLNYNRNFYLSKYEKHNEHALYNISDSEWTIGKYEHGRYNIFIKLTSKQYKFWKKIIGCYE